MGVVESLLRSRKFWLAVVGVVEVLVFHFVPGFPDVIWQAILALIVVLIGAIAAQDVAAKRAAIDVRLAAEYPEYVMRKRK